MFGRSLTTVFLASAALLAGQGKRLGIVCHILITSFHAVCALNITLNAGGIVNVSANNFLDVSDTLLQAAVSGFPCNAYIC